MTDTFKGNYPIEHRAGEIERLRIQAAAMAPEALARASASRPARLRRPATA